MQVSSTAVPRASDLGFRLLWSDEFAGTSIDTASWTFENGDGSQYGIPGWGNQELQVYQQQNAEVAGGVLAIRADVAPGGGYVSARLAGAAGRAFAPGPGETLRIEARIQLPRGRDGIWPAFWMLPAKLGNGSLAYGPWPVSGEIDIMEAVNDMSVVMGTAHFGNPKGQLGGQLAADVASGPFASAYHVYAVDWSWESIIWYVDGREYGAAENSCRTPGGWYSSAGSPRACGPPFDQPFRLLLNVAVGGLLPNKAPSKDTVFPQTMLAGTCLAGSGTDRPRPPTLRGGLCTGAHKQMM
ncbi:g4672 [Coccomyxa elongata]